MEEMEIVEFEITDWWYDGLPPVVVVVQTPWGVGVLMTVVGMDRNWSAS